MGKMERLDKLLALHLAESRKEVSSMVRRGLVLVNGVPAKKGG